LVGSRDRRDEQGSAVPNLKGKVAVVTGASRGIGKGIAEGLAEAGATVYVTGRSRSRRTPPEPLTIDATAAAVDALGGKGIAVQVDHERDEEIKALFERVEREQGRLDLLVNNVYKIPDPPVWSGGFWEHPVSLWDDQCGVGLRGHYVASVYGAPLMVRARSGLIVNISSGGGGQYLFSVSYGVGKCAVDRMAKDMAVELRPYHVAALSLWPGAVRTEFVMAAIARGDVGFDPRQMESPRFTGRCVAALATDANVMEKSGGVHQVAKLAKEYGFEDIPFEE
jgi:dehydrogenase/reductase SDR family protein 1